MDDAEGAIIFVVLMVMLAFTIHGFYLIVKERDCEWAYDVNSCEAVYIPIKVDEPQYEVKAKTVRATLFFNGPNYKEE